MTKEEQKLYYEKQFNVKAKDDNIGNARLTIKDKDPSDISYTKKIKIMKIKDLVDPEFVKKYLSPEFQREYIWDEHDRQASDLIESLLYQHHISDICLMHDNEGYNWLFDGIQRITSIIRFIVPELIDNPVLRLRSNNKRLNKKLFSDLSKEYQNTILNQEVAVTIHEPKIKGGVVDENDMASIYSRLNQMGTKLSNGELLFGTYRGALMNQIDYWANDIDFINALHVDTRRKHNIELVLRLLMVSTIGSDWTGGTNLRNTLPDFAHKHQYLNNDSKYGRILDANLSVFNEIVNVMYALPIDDLELEGGSEKKNKARNRVLQDGLWYGFSRIAITDGAKLTNELALELAEAYVTDKAYKKITLPGRTWGVDSMRGRFTLADEIFGSSYGKTKFD